MNRRRNLDELVIEAGQRTGERDYWLAKLAGEIEKSFFPYDYKKTVDSKRVMAAVTDKFPPALSSTLVRLSNGSDARLFLMMTTLLIILLHKYTGKNDLVLGAPILTAGVDSGRDFTNTVIALRVQIEDDMTFKELLSMTGKTCGEAVENQGYPIEILIEELGLPFMAGDFPLFDVAIMIENIHERSHLDRAVPGIIFSFSRENEGIRPHLEYNSSLYDAATAERIMSHFKRLAETLFVDAGMKISAVDILSREEKKQLLYEFNDTAASYPGEKTIHALFSEQVRKNPDNTAVVGAAYAVPGQEENDSSYQKVSLTYEQFDREAGRLAAELLQKGIGSGSIVALSLARSVEMVVAIFAVLKAGGAYLPIDPQSPEARKQYMLKDSNADLLLEGPKTFPKGPAGHLGASRRIKSFVGSRGGFSKEPLVTESVPADPAYIIYTSGTTGKPKGVIVRHGSVVNIIDALQRLYPLEEPDAYLLKTSYVFDVSAAELFGWFQAGGKLAILQKDWEKEPGKIIAAIEKFAVTHINFVPSMFNVFVEELTPGNIGKLAGLKYIFLAGEELLPELAKRFGKFNTHIKLENIYGPTEGTIYSSNYSLSAWNGTGGIPIGKPMQNIQLYILGKADDLLPIGVPGELCISGAGLAMGYLNNPELSAERFAPGRAHHVPREFDIPENQSPVPLEGARAACYKTGDLCRWLPTGPPAGGAAKATSGGTIEFLGRIDQQVKIRGFRIELGEIENRLLGFPGVDEALALAKEYKEGDKYLCAYIVSQSAARIGGSPAFPSEEEYPEIGVEAGRAGSAGSSIDTAGLREHLSRTLPFYMIPTFFIPIEKMPLNRSGKIDRKALPEPGGAHLESGVEYAAPENRLEEIIAHAWQETLGLPRIGIHDNFFDIGGNSLNVSRVNRQLKEKLDITIPAVTMFRYTTVKKLAGYLSREDTQETVIQETADRKDKLDEGKKRRLRKIDRGTRRKI